MIGQCLQQFVSYPIFLRWEEEILHRKYDENIPIFDLMTECIEYIYIYIYRERERENILDILEICWMHCYIVHTGNMPPVK